MAVRVRVAVGGGVIVLVLVDLVELADEVAGFGELGEVDLAAADEVEDDVAQVGEGVVAAAAGARVVEAGAAFAGAALEGIADDAGGGPDEGVEGASQLGRAEATASLASHGDKGNIWATVGARR